MIPSQADLTALVAAYAAAEPDRARGGVVALLGLQYQIWVYLADFAAALASNQLVDGGQQFDHGFESLSDHTGASSTGLLCVQVKHHLDHDRMGAAAVEFAAIERFIDSNASLGLQGQVTYEVVAKSGASNLDWQSVQLPLAARKRHPALVPYFDKLRASGRLLKPRLEPDPHWRLIAAVYDRLRDPFAFARRAFELCLHRSQEPQSAAFVRATIADEFAKDRIPNRSSRTLRPADFASDVNGRQHIVLARTPTLLDLRRGSFMARPSRVDDLMQTLDDLRRASADFHEATIPVLWIDGRSGSGKTVLLLQVMERLVVERHAHALWFANSTDELLPTIQHLSEAPSELLPEFIIVDDIYDPQTRDELNLPDLARRVVHSGRTHWPVLLTCGPTEFRQDFARDCRSEGFRIVPWHLSGLERAETVSLSAWFRNRTGRSPELGPASQEERGLMISVMFEMEHGDLAPFAARFRNRLVGDQLDDVLSVPLALNRLYIWTPRRWLSDSAAARLEALNQDGDFTLLAVEAKGRELFRLTHPHLSDAIYLALHPGKVPATLARHLVTAFSTALASHPPTAVRVLRAVAARPPRLDIVDDSALLAGMAAAWNRSDLRNLPASVVAESWVDWTRWAAREPTVAAVLGVSPLQVALDSLVDDHARWAMLWIRLWNSAPGDPRLVERAFAWLPTHLGAQGWSFVWRRLTEPQLELARSTNAASETCRALLTVGLEWLRGSLDQRGWSNVWTTLESAHPFISPDTHAAVIALGVDWISSSENRHATSWNYVWQRLAELADEPPHAHLTAEIDEIGTAWLSDGGNLDHPGWPFVWQYFMNRDRHTDVMSRAELVQMARYWSVDRNTDPAWIFVTTKLATIATGEAKYKALDEIVQWLSRSLHLPRWPISWYNLFHLRRTELSHEQRQLLFGAACTWLTIDDEREYGPFLLSHVLGAIGDFDVVRDEKEWLQQAHRMLVRTIAGDERHWVLLWFAALGRVAAGGSSEATQLGRSLLILGRQWLRHPEHLPNSTWSQVYRRAYLAGADEPPAIREMAISGVVHGVVPDGAALIAKLFSQPSHPGPPDDLLHWLNEWFAGPASKSGGFSVWRRLDVASQEACLGQPDAQWVKLRDLLERHKPVRAENWESVVARHRQGLSIMGRVVKTVLQKKRGSRPKRLGYVVDIGVNAFLAVDEADIEKCSDFEQQRLALVGAELELDIVRLDEERFQVDVSRRALVERRQYERLSALEIGEELSGHVKGVQEYGVFIDLGFIDGLLHVSEIEDGRQGHPSVHFTVGQPLVARVLNVDLARRRLSLTMKAQTARN
jgi:hypothetical protein